VGRGDLSRLALLILVLAVAVPAAAASTIPFRVVAHGISSGTMRAKPFAVVGTSRVSAHVIAADLSSGDAQAVLRTNFRTSIAVGVFGAFGCKDARVHVTRVTQSGTMLTVHLSIKRLPPGTMECLAVFETARVLVIPRGALHGTPTRATVTVAGA
jgi:hypothetical protein